MNTKSSVLLPLYDADGSLLISMTAHTGSKALHIPAIMRGKARLSRLVFVPDDRSSEKAHLVVKSLHSSKLPTHNLIVGDTRPAMDFEASKEPAGLMAYPLLSAGADAYIFVQVEGALGETACGTFYLEVETLDGSQVLFEDLLLNAGRERNELRATNGETYDAFRSDEGHIDLKKYAEGARGLISCQMIPNPEDRSTSLIGLSAGESVVVTMPSLPWSVLRPVGLRVRADCDDGCTVQVADLHIGGEPSLTPEGEGWVNSDAYSAAHQLRRLTAHPDIISGDSPVRLRLRAIGEDGAQATVSADLLCEVLQDDAFSPGSQGALPGRPFLGGLAQHVTWNEGLVAVNVRGLDVVGHGPKIDSSPPQHIGDLRELPAGISSGDGTSVLDLETHKPGDPESGIGREVLVPMIIDGSASPDVSLNIFKGERTSPVVKLSSLPVSDAILRIAGVKIDFGTSKKSIKVEMSDFKIGGSSNLLPFGKTFPDACTTPALRAYPVLISPNRSQIQIRLRSDKGKKGSASGRVYAICQVLRADPPSPPPEPPAETPQAPAPSRKIIVPMMLEGSSSPIIEMELEEGAKRSPSVTLKTPTVPWGTLRLVGVEASFKASSRHIKAEVGDLKILGSPCLFMSDQMLPSESLTIGDDEVMVALRSYPVLVSPNHGMMDLRLSSPLGKKGSVVGRVSLICEVMKDNVEAAVRRETSYGVAMRPGIHPASEALQVFTRGAPGGWSESTPSTRFSICVPAESEEALSDSSGPTWSLIGDAPEGSESLQDGWLPARLRRIADDIEASEG